MLSINGGVRVCLGVHVIGFCWKFCNHLWDIRQTSSTICFYRAFLWKCNIDRLQYSGVLLYLGIYLCLGAFISASHLESAKANFIHLNTVHTVCTRDFFIVFTTEAAAAAAAVACRWHNYYLICKYPPGILQMLYLRIVPVPVPLPRSIQCSIQKPQNKLTYCLVFCFR